MRAACTIHAVEVYLSKPNVSLGDWLLGGCNGSRDICDWLEFSCGWRTAGAGGGGNSAFQGFSASIGKVSFWRGDWALGYRSVELRHFPDIS